MYACTYPLPPFSLRSALQLPRVTLALHPALLLLPPHRLAAQLLPPHLRLLLVAPPARLPLAPRRLRPARRLTVPPLSVDTLPWLPVWSVLPLLLFSKEVVAPLSFN